MTHFKKILLSLVLFGAACGVAPEASSTSQTYPDACSAQYARCQKGDDAACQLHADRCVDHDTSTGDLTTSRARVSDTCSTKCCAACTRCANLGVDCDVCYRDCDKVSGGSTVFAP